MANAAIEFTKLFRFYFLHIEKMHAMPMINRRKSLFTKHTYISYLEIQRTSVIPISTQSNRLRRIVLNVFTFSISI